MSYLNHQSQLVCLFRRSSKKEKPAEAGLMVYASVTRLLLRRLSAQSQAECTWSQGV